MKNIYSGLIRTLFVVAFFTLLFTGSSMAQGKQMQVAAIGFYNFENLFDTIDQPDVIDEEFLPRGIKNWTGDKYWDKLSKLDEVVSKLATDLTPDGVAILGVAEIENRGVLEDFVKQKGVASRKYKIVHYDSPDRRGVDVGLLYNPKYFTPEYSIALPLVILDETGNRNYTRDVLYVRGSFAGEQLHIMVNHWPSRRGGEAATRGLRNAAADICRHVADSIQAIDPNAKIIVMGDLNDDPVNESLKKHLRAQKDIKLMKAGDFFNPFENFYLKGVGSLAYQDAWSLFDNIIISGGLAGKEAKGFHYYKAEIYNKPFMVQKSGRYKGYPMRTFDFDVYMGGYSDHFPTYIYFIKSAETP